MHLNNLNEIIIQQSFISKIRKIKISNNKKKIFDTHKILEKC